MKYPKIIKCSLGGGTALSATIFGSLKLSDNISYNRKIARYEQIAKDFSSFGLQSDSIGGAGYLPKYTDDEAWQETHKNKYKDEEKKRQEFLKKHPKWETFRDSCYENADKKVHFNGTHGGGSECARQDGGDLETRRKAKP